MKEIFERFIPYFKNWLFAFIPGVCFAFLAYEILRLDFSFDSIFYDAATFFVIGKIILSLGAIVVSPISLVLQTEADASESKQQTIKKLKYIFNAAVGTFLALVLCFAGLWISAKSDYSEIIFILAGLCISVAAFVVKMAKR